MTRKTETRLSQDRGIAKKSSLGIIVILLVTVPLWAGDSILNVMSLIMLYMAIGQMWNLLGGYSGLVSLGQQIFIGIGGYSMAVITYKYEMSLYLGIALGGLLSVIFALVISFPIFKMKGVYFTIGTWIVAETLLLFFTNSAYVNYAAGLYITVGRTRSWSFIYFLSLALGVGSVILVYFLMRTKMGMALMAMRDNESAAEAMGVEIYKTKLKIFLISSFVTGMTGAVMFINVAFFTPYSGFSISWTVAAVFIVIIGGIGTMEGPIIGAVIYVVLNQYLYNLPGISMIILGAVAIITIMIAPTGIMGILHDKFNIELLSPRRRIKKIDLK
jgi:branched-chain amino acid transport system permease protein